MKNINVDFDCLFSLLKAHRDKEIEITYMEDSLHHPYNFESLITNLKL